MKYTILILLIFTAACTTSDKAPSEQEEISIEEPHQIEQSTETVQSSPSSEVQPIKELIASIPEHEIYMYSDHSEGVTLQVGGRSRHFDWEYMTPRQILPVMAVNDYDNDGEDELSIILYVGSGTGLSIEELHIIEWNGASLEDHVFDNSVELVSGKVSLDVVLDNGIPSGEIRIDSDKYPIEFPLYDENDQGKIHEQLFFGNIIGFYTEERQLKARFGAGVHYDNWVTPDYIGDVIADVTYQGGAFMMSNYTFVRLAMVT